MPPKALFPSIIKTHPKNKDIHPGEVINQDDHGNPKPKRRTAAEMKEVRHQQELARQVAEENSQNAIAAVGSVEDSLREEDIARLTRPNRQLENIPAFRAPASATKGKDSSTLCDQRFHPKLIVCFPEADNHRSESVPAVTVEKSDFFSKRTEHEDQIKGNYFRWNYLTVPIMI